MAFHKPPITLIATFLLLSSLQAQDLDKMTAGVQDAAFHSLKEFLSIPNDAHFPEDLEKNILWLEEKFGERGFETRRLPTARIPLLLAEQTYPNATKTLLIYVQVDGQPVDPNHWFQPHPFQPVLKEKNAEGEWTIIPWDRLSSDFDPEWRVFARAASDAKGPIIMLLHALDAMKTAGISPVCNLKIIMDTEEEMGSPNLPASVEAHKDILASDMLIILDGPRHISNQPTLTFGARGISTISLQVFGPRVAQHSGHYGNYAPNPALRLSQLLASMKDEQGKVIIPGFYDGIVLTESVKHIMAEVPDNESDIRRKVGIAEIDAVGNSYQEAIQYPSLNIRGLSSGWVGEEVRTIVPATATAEIDVRLVPECDPERLIGLIKDHIARQGYHFVSGEPTEEERQTHSRLISFTYKISYQAYRTPFDSEIGHWLTRALTQAFGTAPVRIRNSGGSIPISPFINILGVPAVTVPTVNRDNNQHSPNENIRLGNFVEGIKTVISVLSANL
ncbi:MAG: M20/M25/M40 family metallo-hydrolase [Bacteroidota bacterium]